MMMMIMMRTSNRKLWPLGYWWMPYVPLGVLRIDNDDYDSSTSNWTPLIYKLNNYLPSVNQLVHFHGRLNLFPALGASLDSEVRIKKIVFLHK